ncbi:dienelactone hydrolase family protein [Ralstonia insidiosa]|jgi:dienelactone hydrolase|uniref:dienelactone hydrolase family protein n=1 Tax=Ralstonia TaxID=48736 RepID=UPI000664B665|nr:dienelactone hydrolase family protein [Ralstonia insidiosa]KMW44239.1 dienelactone hydrolase [Ralstonia sp. MD27]MBX3771404.1 dienelactone hydrolase family protein [Ralstonia pickettii]NOZ16104.1 dienelactone hydrolase [Betaproteobacteria bacterium]MBA9855350.1 dienelactone hydrolase [Ralstonia insidiosa]MBA9869414.1 dienelactone hydrolase [Ralstonia insidiosa]
MRYEAGHASHFNRWVSCLIWLAAVVLSPMAVAQALQPDTQGRIEFNSFTPKTMFDLARERRQNWPEQKIWGDLSLPKTDAAKVPAIVLVHGSSGVEPAMAQWVQALNEVGVATFVIYIFEPRGVKRTVEDQTRVPHSADMVDAYQALQLLATHPRIDPARIGIMGFSRGGTVAFQTEEEPLRRAVIKSDLKFALHIPVYAACSQVYWSPELSRAPMLNLVGADDDYVMPEPCEQLAKRYADAGVPVRTIRYDSARHGWDSTVALAYLGRATKATSCGVVRWDIDTWTVTAERTGEVIEPAKLRDFFAGCMSLGAHVGRNEAAYQKSRKDVQAFVREVFFPGH